MRHANNAEQSYSELQAKWQLAQRESQQAKIAKRRAERRRDLIGQPPLLGTTFSFKSAKTRAQPKSVYND